MNDKTAAITIEFDLVRLRTYDDRFLATLWHVAQANPAPHGDKKAGEVAEKIGREIIRRWLGTVEPELWRHQGRDHYWAELSRLARYERGEPDFEDGRWVVREQPQEDPS